MDIQTIQHITQPVFRKYNIQKAAVFGSQARNEAHVESDVDILVELPERASLFDFINLKLALEEGLKKSVDLVEYKAIKPRLKSYILSDERIIYQKS